MFGAGILFELRPFQASSLAGTVGDEHPGPSRSRAIVWGNSCFILLPLPSPLPAYLPTCLLACLPACLPTYLPTYLPTHLHAFSVQCQPPPPVLPPPSPPP